MAPTFNSVPADSRVPFIYLEFDGAQAQQGPGLQPYKVLVVGLRKSGGSVAEKVPKLVTSTDQAIGFFGAGSMLHQMAASLFANNKNTSATFIALDETGTKATGTITITGAATAAGTVSLYVAGELIQVQVASGDSVTVVAAAIAAAITARTHLPVTAAAAVGVVTLTAQQSGTVGNSIDVRLNRFAGEADPAGLAFVLVAVGGVVAGSGEATVDATLWAALGDEHFNVMAIGLAPSSAVYTALDTELADRAGPVRAIESVACLASRDSHSNQITLGDGQNSEYMSTLGLEALFLSLPWEASAAYGGVIAREGKTDPARPFQTLELSGLVAADEADRYTLQERDLLLRDGIATQKIGGGSRVLIERAITMYQETATGAPSTAFLDVNTVLTLGFLRYDTRNRFAAKYPRHKLANDGTKVGAGQAVLTPSLIKAELLGYFLSWEELGLVEGFSQFKSDLIVERSSTDPNRVDVVMPPDLVNQLRVVGAAIRFLL